MAIQESQCRISRRHISGQGPEAKSPSQDLSEQRKSSSRRSDLVSILRRITMAVQVFPFIYSALFVFLFGAYSATEGVWLDILDYASFVSPVVVIAHLIYSRMLKMCRWHRIACALPLLPQAVDQFDLYVFRLGHIAWIVVSATILVTIVLFLIAFYKVFFTDEGRIC